MPWRDSYGRSRPARRPLHATRSPCHHLSRTVEAFMASGSAPWRALAPHFLSLLRLIAGLLLLEFGTMKILHFPYADYFSKVPQGCSAVPGEPLAIQLGGSCTISLIWIAGLLELIGGALLTAGLFTRL